MLAGTRQLDFEVDSYWHDSKQKGGEKIQYLVFENFKEYKMAIKVELEKN